MTDIWELIQAGGVPAALFIFVYLGMRKVIVWGYQLLESEARCAAYKAERDELLEKLFTVMDSFRVGVTVAEKAIDVAKNHTTTR